MRIDIRPAAMVAVGMVLVVACSGGGGTASTPGGGTSATPSTVAPPAATSAAPPSAAAGSAAPPAAGGPATGVCALVNTDELAGIFGVPVTSQVIAGPPDTCDIQSNDAPLAAMVLTPIAATYVYDAYAGDPGAVTVPGMGDKAAYSPTAQLLVILKGEALLSIAVTGQDTTPEQRLELMKKVGTIAAGRM